jgi:hypothetical protein
MSRYDALAKQLSALDDEVVELSFEEIDDLVGGLPPSARKHASWWANSKKPSGQARFWISAGRKAQPDMTQHFVSFRRAEIEPLQAKAEPKAKASRSGPTDVTTRRPVTLVPTGEFIRTSVAYEWQSAGQVQVVGDKLSPPVLPPRPGIYRFKIDSNNGISYYVGETDNLFRRMGHYRNPGPSQPTNIRMSELLMKVHALEGTVTVDVVTSALLGGESLDLSHKAARYLVESAALCELNRTGASVENL